MNQPMSGATALARFASAASDVDSTSTRTRPHRVDSGPQMSWNPAYARACAVMAPAATATLTPRSPAIPGTSGRISERSSVDQKMTSGRITPAGGRRIPGLPVSAAPRSADAPAAVDVEGVGAHAAVEQQELRGVDDVGHRGQLPSGRAALVSREHALGFAGPEGAVADDAGMQGVHPDRRELEREGVHQPVDAAVDARYGGRTRVRGVLGTTAEKIGRAHV